MGSTLTATAFFSGIGGFCYGFKQADIPTVQAVELDSQAVATYSYNFPEVRVINKDIRQVSIVDDGLIETDVWHAGFPCQSFSQAGARRGFSDPRGELVFDMLRLAKEMGDKRPSVIVLENAPYFKIGEGGAWLLRLAKELKKAGYWFRESNCCELDPFDISSLPQQRNRLFMVAFSTNCFRNGRFSFPKEKSEEPKELARYIDFSGVVEDYYYLDEENRYHKMISGYISGEPSVYQLRKYMVRAKPPNICPTLTANMGLGGHNVPFICDGRGLRKLTEYECAALQGFPEGFVFPESVNRSRRYMQIGNAVSVPVVKAIAHNVRRKIEEERKR